MKPPTPPQSACGHPNAGQELCYLCHQRARRNIPVNFTEERRRREAEEDKLLQQFQYMKDAEDTLKDQVSHTDTLTGQGNYTDPNTDYFIILYTV